MPIELSPWDVTEHMQTDEAICLYLQAALEDYHPWAFAIAVADAIRAKRQNEAEAEIQRQIANDPDAAEATDEQLAQAKPFAEAHPELFASIRAKRGRQA